MGDRPGKLKFVGACVAALAGGVLAAAVASAQGPGDYEPTTTTPGGGTPGGGTTTLPAPGGGQLAFRAKATRAAKLGAFVKVNVYCDEVCSANAFGRLRLTKIKKGKGKDSESFRLGNASGVVSDGHEIIKLKVPNAGRIEAKRAKKFGGRVRAKITVNAADAAGNTGLERLRLNFRDVK